VPTARLGIAVDGGGTKTTACIAALADDGSSVILGQATSGSANPAAVGLTQTKANIALAIGGAMVQAELANLAKVKVGRLIAGLAGIEATSAHEELAAWARQEFHTAHATFVTDVELLHFAGSRQLPAIVLISGTGSVAFGRDAAGKPARTGGRGYLMGDEGSGFWIGQRGLHAAVRALDGAAPPTALVQFIGQDLGCEDANGWTKEIYSTPDPRHRIAQLSQRVVQAAAKRDTVAIEILEASGRELAHLVQSVARQLGLIDHPFDLVLAGGILVHVEDVRVALDTHLKRLALPIQTQRLIEYPASEAARRCVALGHQRPHKL
jgi:N-acetylglucosamine kinase-like BadF-type ATPase